MPIEHNEARRYLRFPPDPKEVAYIDFNCQRDNFTIKLAALIVDVAPKGGCSLVFTLPSGETIKDNQRCRIKIGDLLPVTAEVVWHKQLDRNIYRCGFIFLE